MCANHPVGDVPAAMALDRARRALPDRKGVEQQRDHHRRLTGDAAMAVRAIVGVELAQIHLLNRLEQKPRQMVLRQPLAQRRRQQERLLTITPDEVLGHSEIVIADPDGAGVCATASWQSDSAAKPLARPSAWREQRGSATAGPGDATPRGYVRSNSLALLASLQRSGHPIHLHPSAPHVHELIRRSGLAARSFMPGCFKTRRCRDSERTKPPHTFAPADACAVVYSGMRLLKPAGDAETAAAARGGA